LSRRKPRGEDGVEYRLREIARWLREAERETLAAPDAPGWTSICAALVAVKSLRRDYGRAADTIFEAGRALKKLKKLKEER
jgi:phytoene/squalene synthetase